MKHPTAWLLCVIALVLLLYLLGCAIGTRQEWWLRPTADIQTNTNLSRP